MIDPAHDHTSVAKLQQFVGRHHSVMESAKNSWPSLTRFIAGNDYSGRAYERAIAGKVGISLELAT